MKATVIDRYGPPDVLELADIDRPSVGDGEVLVRIVAASAQAGDWHLVRGEPYFIRLMFGLRKPKSRVTGQDVAGRVEAVGPNVTGLEPGDEVFGASDGAFAEYLCAAETKLARKPTNLTFEQAATVPSSGLTALRALRDWGSVEAGQKVLVVGAAGGVGTFAVQIAKAFGTEVTGVCSTRNTDLVRSLGADHVVDYTREDFTRGEATYDLILDAVGARSIFACRRALTPTGTLVLIGGRGGKWLGGIQRWLQAMVVSPLVGQRLKPMFQGEIPPHDDLVALTELIESGKVTPVIDRSYDLSEVPEAIRYLEQGHARGKVVITV